VIQFVADCGRFLAFRAKRFGRGNSRVIFTTADLKVSARAFAGAVFCRLSGERAGGNSTGLGVVYDLDAVNHTFTATWDDIAHFDAVTGGASPYSAFQVKLVDEGGGDFDIGFRMKQSTGPYQRKTAIHS
jgi:hypothetical protein